MLLCVVILALLALWKAAESSRLKRKVSDLQWKYGQRIDQNLMLNQRLKELQSEHESLRLSHENHVKRGERIDRESVDRELELKRQVESRDKRIEELEQRLSEEVNAHNVSKKVIEGMKKADDCFRTDTLMVMNEISGAATRLQEHVDDIRSRF